MSRVMGFATLLVAAALLGGCAAAAPGIGAPPTPPAEAAVQAAAIQATAPPAVPPTPPATTLPATATATAIATASPIAAPAAPTATATAGVGGAAAERAFSLQPGGRPPLPPPPADGLSMVVESGPNGRLEVALTFDAGADTGYAAAILDLLRDEGIPATFGMTGQWAQANPELIQRMVAEGHQLINHTWDHSSLTGANTGLPPLTAEQVAVQLGDTEAVVADLTGYDMKPYFRPPYGDYDQTSLGYLFANGYYVSVWWTCDTRGWAGWPADQIVGYCTTNIKPHEIILLHVGAAAVGDYEALQGLIDFFRGQGYTFVTVEQMLQP